MRRLIESMVGKNKPVNESITVAHAEGDIKNAEFIKYGFIREEVEFQTLEELEFMYNTGEKDDLDMLNKTKKMKSGDYFITSLWLLVKI